MESKDFEDNQNHQSESGGEKRKSKHKRENSNTNNNVLVTSRVASEKSRGDIQTLKSSPSEYIHHHQIHDRTQIISRASELKMSEKKRVRSASHGTQEDVKEDKDEQPKALPRDRTFSGNLSKKTKGIRSVFMKTHTTDRTFSIDNGVLTYSGKGKEPAFKIPIDEIKSTKLDIKNDVKKGKFAFQIETPKRNFIVYADTEEERHHWLNFLRPRKENEGLATAIQSVFKGDLNFTVGEEREWIVQGIDKYGQLCVEGGNRVTGVLRRKMISPKNISEDDDPTIIESEPPEEIISEPLDILDLGNGVYCVKLNPKISCSGKLSLQIDGDELNGSPYDFSFNPCQPSLKNSSITGNGIKDTKMYLHSKITITIQDIFDNPVPNIPPEVIILTKDGGEAKFEIKKEPKIYFNHIWEVIYIADKEGEYKVLISVGGEKWGDFPILITKAPASAQKSVASGPGLKKVYQYKQTSFKITVNDERGRKCPGDHHIAVKYQSLDKKDLGKFETKISKNEDDTWSVSYVPAIGGTFLLSVFLYDQELQGCPFTVDVAPAHGAVDKCKIEGPGLTATKLYEATKCIVTVNDQMGRRVKEAEVGVAFGGKQVEFNIIDNGDGTFIINFTPNSPGILIMSVTVDRKQMKGSPWQLNINESLAVDPQSCYTVGNGIKECIQYNRADFSVFLRDEKNNPVSKGNIALSLNGTEKFEYSVANSDIGSYFVRYKTTAPPGDYKLNVTVDGHHIKNSPFFLNVEEGNADDEIPLDAGFPRLIRLSVNGKHVITTLVPLSYSSLNTDGVFLLDNEINIYQWNGPSSSRVLKVGAGYLVKVLNYDRRSGIQHKIIEDPYCNDPDTKLFWSLLGITGEVPRTFEGDASKVPDFIPRCLLVNEDETVEIISEGSALKQDILLPDKLILLDTGFEIFAWEGRNCPNSLKRYAYQAGKDYIRQYKRPEGILIRHILDGSENWTMKHFLNQENVI